MIVKVRGSIALIYSVRVLQRIERVIKSIEKGVVDPAAGLPLVNREDALRTKRNILQKVHKKENACD